MFVKYISVQQPQKYGLYYSIESTQRLQTSTTAEHFTHSTIATLIYVETFEMHAFCSSATVVRCFKPRPRSITINKDFQ